MGNYSGTIRCGHCYERGHNRAGCEKLTEQMAYRFERLRKEVENGSRPEDDYTYQRTREKLAKRIGEDPITGESKRKRRKTYGGRKCSYCNEPGHTRRTCPSMKKDQATYRSLTAQSRSTLIERMHEAGFGPGSLLTTEVSDYADGEYKKRTVPMLVKSVRWESIHRQTWPQTGSVGPECVVVVRMDNNQTQVIQLPNSVTGGAKTWNSVDIAGRVAEVKPPAGWATGASLDLKAVELFETGKARDWYFWRSHDE